MRKKQIVILGIVMSVALLGLIFKQAEHFQMVFELKKAQFDYLLNKSIDQVVTGVEEQLKIKRYEQKVADEEGVSRKAVHEMPAGLGIMLSDNMDISIGYSDVPLTCQKNRVYDQSDFGRQGNGNLLNSIEKSRKDLKERFGKDYDLVVVNKDQNMISWKEHLKDIDLIQEIKNRFKENGVEGDFEYALKENGYFLLLSPSYFNSNSNYTYHWNLPLNGITEVATLFIVFPDKSHDWLSSLLLLVPSIFITCLLVTCFVLCMMEIVKQKKLSSIKNDFINNMTHEFKTPIATISLAAQMLKDCGVNHTPEMVDKYAGIIRDESKRLTFQVEKVLQTALFTETRMKLKLKEINLNEVVESLATKFALRVEDKKGKLYCYPEAERDDVFVDEVHITNVISNLLDNAIKYSSKTVEISISTKNKNDEIIVSVIDNGIGIAAKEQKLIFERFYRVSTGNLHDVKGFGLGLSYVKAIVEAHDGRIEVESEEGKGSRFDVILPLVTSKCKTRKTLLF